MKVTIDIPHTTYKGDFSLWYPFFGSVLHDGTCSVTSHDVNSPFSITVVYSYQENAIFFDGCISQNISATHKSSYKRNFEESRLLDKEVFYWLKSLFNSFFGQQFTVDFVCHIMEKKVHEKRLHSLMNFVFSCCWWKYSNSVISTCTRGSTRTLLYLWLKLFLMMLLLMWLMTFQLLQLLIQKRA